MGRGQGGGGQRRGGMDDKILEKLNLTVDQKTKIKALKEGMMAKMKKAFEDSKGDREKMKATMQPLRKNYTDSLSKILTKAQMEAYMKEMKAQRAQMEKMRAERGGGPGGPGGKAGKAPTKP